MCAYVCVCIGTTYVYAGGGQRIRSPRTGVKGTFKWLALGTELLHKNSKGFSSWALSPATSTTPHLHLQPLPKSFYWKPTT